MSDAEIHPDDVDDILNLAAEKRRKARERLTLADLREVAVELGISTEHLESAQRELERRRQAERAAGRRLRQKLVIAAGGAALIGIVALLAAWGGHSGLAEARAVVKQKRAQVRNVIERRAVVLSRYAREPSSPERDAEIDGAENRVRIEIQRYDEAVTSYNAAAGTFPGTVWVALFDLSDQLPLSSELDAPW